MKNQSILQSWDDSQNFEQREKGIDPNRSVLDLAQIKMKRMIKT